MSDSYSIRRDLLVMCKDILMQEWQLKVKNQLDPYQQQVDRFTSFQMDTAKITYPTMPPVPTADEIISMATKLNLWVSSSTPAEYRRRKESEQAASLDPFGIAEKKSAESPSGKPRYLLTVKANASSSIAPGKWEKTANTQEEAMRIAHNWSESTRQATEATGPGNGPKWYINPDTFDAQWNHDNIFFSIREIS